MPNETPAQLRAFRRDRTTGLGDTVKFNALDAPYGRRTEDPSRSACRDIRRESLVRWDGRMPLCGYNGHREWIGDVHTDRLAVLWHAPRLEQVWRSHEAHDLTELPFCKTCTHR
jgi:hypothetical protein